MCLNLLLFCLINVSESPAEGNNLIHVTGKKGGNVTLTCGSEDREIVDISLISRGKHIPVCEKKNCRGRVFKEGSDVIITDLIYSDAGKYILHVYYTNDQSEVEREILEYHLHIHDEISVKKGEDLKLDVLLINADKVERNSSSGWTELWTRGHGVNSDRLTDRDGNLTINEFTVNDTGTYRVLDSNNEIWITVTVTESDSGSKETHTDDDKPDEKRTIGFWIIVCVSGALLVLLSGITVAVMCCLSRRLFLPLVPIQASKRQSRTSSDVTGYL